MKQWKGHIVQRERPPVNPRLMIQLPLMLNGDRIYIDRKYNRVWREETCNGPSTWSYYDIPPLRKRPCHHER